MKTLGSERKLTPGETLYREGDANDTAYVIADGEIILHRKIDGRRVDLEIRPTGSVVGELSILTCEPRAVSAEARTHCTVFEIPAQLIYSRFEALDPILRACVETSINFAGTLNQKTKSGSDETRHAPTTLRDADELLQLLRLENDISKGLTQGEFSMVYQPIVRLKDERIMGLEALMRWQHPEHGFVPPDKFIRVAEELETITQLTHFALSEACAALTRFNAGVPAEDDLYVSVNVSGFDVGQDGFLDFLEHVLDQNNLERRHLRLELTETALVPASKTAEANLRKLHSCGFNISVDDFGTGYSNLGYLKSLPVTALKIDRAFAGDADENDVSKSIVRMLVTLGLELNVDIIAEGLETQSCVETLRDLGCRLAQGYHFFKPMPASAVEDLLAQGHARQSIVA